MLDEGKFTLVERKGVKIYTIPSFDKTKIVKHCFTTRIKGVSQSPFDSLNLSLNKEDKIDDVKENFKIICDALDISLDSLVFSNQVHGTNIKIVEEKNRDIEYITELNQDGVDGLLTNRKGITLCTFYADCVPLYFLDVKKKVIGLAHAGWRGTVERIGEKILDRMHESFGCAMSDILVGIGPSIGPCCYEVGKDVFDKFNNNFTNTEKLLIPTNRDTWDLNLWYANVIILISRGIPLENITVSELCTNCNNDLFYSYRKEKGKTGRMAAMIQLV